MHPPHALSLILVPISSLRSAASTPVTCLLPPRAILFHRPGFSLEISSLRLPICLQSLYFMLLELSQLFLSATVLKF